MPLRHARRQTAKAFCWIVDLLRRAKVPFFISGGLAARSYGSPRPLNDIDIETLTASLDKVRQLAGKYVVQGPYRFKDWKADVWILELCYAGQAIELSGTDKERYYDDKERRWVASEFSMSHTVRKNLNGRIVPVAGKAYLLDYKKRFLSGWPHQQVDIMALSGR